MAGQPPEGRWELRLYVAGQTVRSIAALANLRRVCEDYLAGRFRIEVVDVLVQPGLARGDQIAVIPTLVRCRPGPVRKVVGDLSNTERVVAGLEIDSSPY